MNNRSTTSSNIKMLLICSPLFALAIILSLVSILVNTNGVLSYYTLLLSFVSMISSLCDIFIYAVSFAFIIYAINEKKRFVASVAIFCSLSAIRYFVSAIIGGVIRGAVSRDDMISASIVLGTDLIITGILTFVAFIIHKRAEKNGGAAIAERKSRLLPNLSKPVEKSLFIAGTVWAAIRVASLLIYDISYISIIGAPSAINIVWMVIYYLGAILICPIFYIISKFTLKLIGKNQESSF